MMSRLVASAAVAAPRRRGLLLLACSAVAVILLALSTLVLRSGSHPQREHAPSPRRSGGLPAVSSSPLPQVAASGSAAVAQDLAQLQAMPAVSAATSRLHPAVPAAVRGQPDLYAAAFVTELLSQDYRTPRQDLLAWVQSESAPTSEPLVVGLVPPALRPKLAVWSVTAAPAGGPTPIPSPATWQALASESAYNTLVIQSVTEPSSWVQAVADGRITDPGVAARDVTAVVTTHATAHGRESISRASVTMSLTLEGPPSRSGYGFVNAVIYSVVPIGG
jgi:hypothetical protein